VQVVEGMIQADQLDDQASYLSRGRSLKDLPTPDLQQRWASAFRDMVREQSPQNTVALSDAGAELLLRGLEPDAALVQAELAQVRAMIEQTERTHPDGDPAILEAIESHLRRVNSHTN
jgi:hypothetical protein